MLDMWNAVSDFCRYVLVVQALEKVLLGRMFVVPSFEIYGKFD